MKYGLIGEMLSHSFSRPIHEQMTGEPYELVELAPGEVGPFLAARDFTAVNVTIPYKQTVMAYCDDIDEKARTIGAVNTLVNRGGRLVGYNTDFDGLLYLLSVHDISLAGRRVLVLGSGGTSRTVGAVAAHLGAAEVTVVSRAPGPGQIDYEEAAARRDVDVLINTTPAGMYPHNEGCPMDISGFPRLAAVVDAVYNPLRTRLLQQAQELRIPGANGLPMLVAQAKYAAELFRGCVLGDDLIPRVTKNLLRSLSNVVLIGMPASGKTTLGRALAMKLGKTFVDVDDLIEADAGCTIPGIFAQGGEERFRQIERRMVAGAARESGRVIATGGGVVLHEGNMRALRQNGVILLLDRSLQKLESGGGRPLSQSPEAVARLYRERTPLYRRWADAVIDNNGEPDAALADMEERYYETVGHQWPESEYAGHPGAGPVRRDDL